MSGNFDCQVEAGKTKKWIWQPCYYPRSGRLARSKSGVARRARDVPGEYRRPLAALDTHYHGTPPGEAGPLALRLASMLVHKKMTLSEKIILVFNGAYTTPVNSPGSFRRKSQVFRCVQALSF